MKSLLYAILLCSIPALQAQTIIAEEDLTYYPRLGMEEAAAMDPDSVFAFMAYGYDVDNEDGSEYINLDQLLLFRNLQVLEISGTHAEHVMGMIDHFPLLQYLELRNVAVDNISDGFYSLHNLKILKLENFHALHFDTALMEGNQIHELNLVDVSAWCPDEGGNCDHQLGIFPELRTFKLKGAEYHLPSALFEMPYLESLDLSGCSLSSIDGVEGIYTLKYLDISSNEYLEELPYYLGDLENLEHLVLDNIPLIELPETIGYLSSLISLHISETAVSYLPENFGDLSSLTSLSISDGQLSVVPESFARLESLEVLDLSGNNMALFPGVVCDMLRLSKLNLDRNAFTNIPARLGQLKNLTSLSIENNPIALIEPGALQLPNLFSLYLSHCPLAKMPAGLDGYSLPNIYEIYMDYCGIENFDPSVFSMKTLSFLNLEGNKISLLPKGWKGMTGLRVLYLVITILRSCQKIFHNFPACTNSTSATTNSRPCPRGSPNSDPWRSSMSQKIKASNFPRK